MQIETSLGVKKLLADAGIPLVNVGDMKGLKEKMARGTHSEMRDVACGNDSPLPASVDVATMTTKPTIMVPCGPGRQTRLDPAERTRRMKEHLCLYCADPNHIVEFCRARM